MAVAHTTDQLLKEVPGLHKSKKTKKPIRYCSSTQNDKIRKLRNKSRDLVLTEPSTITDALKQLPACCELHDDHEICWRQYHLQN
jgi:hypothetical protein